MNLGIAVEGGSWGDLRGIWGDFGGCFFKEAFGRRVAALLMGSEDWAACSSGCIWSVSSRPVSLLLSIIELSSQPVALK